MVLEKIFKPYWIERRPFYSFYLGMLFAIFGFLTAFLLFREVVGIAAVFFTVILALPSINVLLKFEEYLEIESKEGFFWRHANIFDIFLYFFLGVFIVFFIIGMINPSYLFSAGITIRPPIPAAPLAGALEQPAAEEGYLAKLPFIEVNLGKVYSIILNNLYVMGIAFLLSVFYGAGSLFLIIYTSSVWASVLAQVVRLKTASAGLFSQGVFAACNLSIMFFHAIPEMTAYVLAAIAGGVLSKAVSREGFRSENFLKVLKDSVLLLAIAALITVMSGFIEVGISEKMFRENSCAANQLILILVGILLIKGVILLEYIRWRQKRMKMHPLEEKRHNKK